MGAFLRATKVIPHPELELVEGRRAALQCIMMVALALALAGCGKKGPPEPPEGKTDQFPRQYPDPSTL
jgi:predicted small lipoprotein YifL